jgi:hypothetical protein
LSQEAGAGTGCGAGGQHVIDQDDAFACQFRFLAAKLKSATHVLTALSPRELRLTPRIDCPLE